ncbi:MAG: hypothetical protein IPJ94_22890 [Chloroflexi bacterium]|nr:hypothetical protein [Chloroflexota bacterium]
MADALLVCEDTKTLAALQRQFVQAPDASNMADFLRISPWQANDVRDVLRHYQVAHLLAAATKTKAPQVIYVNIDDSLGRKTRPPATFRWWIGIMTTAKAPKASRATKTLFVTWSAHCASES